MALVKADRVKESTTTTGTGALTLGGAMTGYRSFASVCATSDTVWYALQAVDGSGVPTGDWEVGLGTYSGTNTLTRTTIYASSNSNAAVNLAAGTKQVWIGLPANQAGGMDFLVGTVEPNKPTTTGLTSAGNSTSTIATGNLTSGRGFYLRNTRAGTSMDSMAHMGKSVPGGSWTLTILASSTLPLYNSSNYSQWGMFVQDASNKTIHVGIAGGSIMSYPGFSYDKWQSWPSSPSYQGRQTLFGPTNGAGPLWMRTVYNGSTYVFDQSVDGEVWKNIWSISSTDFIGTPSTAGLMLNVNYGTTGSDATVTCFHFDIA